MRTKQLFVSLTLGLGLTLALLWLLGGPWLQAVHAQGTIRYVAPGGNCGGASPCYANIQVAVNAAVDGDTIKVTQGVYTSTAFQVVYVSKAIALTGGYTITDWVNSYPLSRPTVLDAENEARRRGIYIDGTSVTTVTLEGLTVQRGYAHDSDGGGVYILTGTVVLRESRVLSSTATGGMPVGQGGGIYVSNGTVTLSGNTFQGNSAAPDGGGVYISNGTVTLSGNTFLSNTVTSGGGGVWVSGGTVILSGNTFQGNFADDYGGGMGVSNGIVTLSGNTFQGNRVNDMEAGGVLVMNGIVTLSDNTFQSNTSSDGGSGVCVWNGTVTLNSNTFLSNTAEYCGGGVRVINGIVTLSGNTFQGNSASHGGGGVSVDNVNAPPVTVTLSGNTVLSNTADTYGGGIYVSANGTVTLNSNIILSNTAGTYGGGIAISGGTVNAQNDIIANNSSPWEGVYLSGDTLTARHWTLADNGNYALTTNGGSAVLTNTIVASHILAGFWGSNLIAEHTLFFNSGIPCGGGASCTNNLTGDPQFINPAAGDYHIGPDSAAIDAGVDAGVTIDIDGDPRPAGTGYDIGADERTRNIYLPIILKDYP